MRRGGRKEGHRRGWGGRKKAQRGEAVREVDGCGEKKLKIESTKQFEVCFLDGEGQKVFLRRSG